jgi:hypothetical protein
VSDNFPYCAAGDQLDLLSASRCEKQNVAVAPWFWGSPACTAEAFRVMAGKDVGYRYRIGYSGPREPGTCQESQMGVRADIRMRYRYNLPDKDCVYHVRVGFENARTGFEMDHFEVEGTTADDETWRIKTDTVYVPLHMHLTIEAWLEEVSLGGLTPDCESPLNESEVWINYLDIEFPHPGTGQSDYSQRIIGYGEGRGSDIAFPAKDLHQWDNVAWEQPNRGSEELKMYFSTPNTAIKIEGPTFRNNEGNFRKRVHLVD